MFEGQDFHRMVALQSVDINTGDVVIFDENTPANLRDDAIVASASLPFLFPTVQMNAMSLVDGGAFTNLDMSEAIVKCKNKGYKDEDIIVDVILCFDKVVKLDRWTTEDAKYKNAWDLYQRHVALRDFYYYYEDITRVVKGYPNV